MAFRLLTFGEMRLLDPSGNAVSFPEKGLLILAYLFAHPQRAQSRSALSKLLWDKVEPAQAYTNLRKTLSRIEARQKELGHGFIEITASDIKLDDRTIQCDVAGFQTPPSSDVLSDLRALVGLFSRLFLESIEHKRHSFSMDQGAAATTPHPIARNLDCSHPGCDIRFRHRARQGGRFADVPARPR